MHSTAAIRQPQQQRQPVITDLESFVMQAFEGQNEHVNVGGAPDVETAERMVVAAIERLAPRALTAHEKGIVGMEVALYWNRRREMRRALLAETQKSLHNPLFGFAR